MMPFETLCEKARKGRKLEPIPPSYRIISFDPGETTGFCVFQGFHLIFFCQYPTEDLSVAAPLLDQLITVHQPDVVLVEDYKVYSTHLAQHEWSELHTPKLVGILEAYALLRKIPVVKQMAGRVKGFVTDTKLVEW